MKTRLAADDHKIQNAIEAIVLSKQFQYQRGSGIIQPASEGAKHE
jgi:hypothetical protein